MLFPFHKVYICRSIQKVLHVFFFVLSCLLQRWEGLATKFFGISLFVMSSFAPKSTFVSNLQSNATGSRLYTEIAKIYTPNTFRTRSFAKRCTTRRCRNHVTRCCRCVVCGTERLQSVQNRFMHFLQWTPYAIIIIVIGIRGDGL